MAQYWFEFVTIATVHLLAVASPGPDFAIVLRHSIRFGRRIAIITSLGIGVAILLHVAYSLLGIGLIIKTTPWLFTGLSYLAALYLLYIAWGALQSQPSDASTEDPSQTVIPPMSDRRAFMIGFVTNGLNPKATLFFLSLFAVAISQETPLNIKLMYGAYLAVATATWFIGLSLLLSTRRVRQWLERWGHWFDRLMGVALLILAVRLVWPQ